MINYNDDICPICGSSLKYYDSVRRIRKIEYGIKTIIFVRRFKCLKCNKIHREIPESLLPYKHYDKQIIFGIVNGTILDNDLRYETLPSDSTKTRWRNFINHSL